MQGEKEAEDQLQEIFHLSSEASRSYSLKRNGRKGSHRHRKSKLPLIESQFQQALKLAEKAPPTSATSGPAPELISPLSSATAKETSHLIF